MTNGNLISQYRATVQRMLATFAECRTLEEVITSQGGVSIFEDTDFVGSNADLNAADFSAIVVSREAIEDFAVTGNHYTNLNKALA